MASPRYHCAVCKVGRKKKGEKSKGSIAPSEAHELFNAFLQEITPSEGGVRLFKEVIKRTAHKRLEGVNQEIRDLRSRQTKIDNDIHEALQRVIEGDLSKEEKEFYIEGKQTQRNTLEDRILELQDIQTISETTIEYVCNFITQPAKLWRDASFEERQALQGIMFPNGFLFDIERRKFGTEGLSPLYSVATTEKAPEGANNSSMVTSRGIEPRLRE